MKEKIFNTASHWAVLVLALVSVFVFASCSSSDDEEKIDEILSDKTTPVTFEVGPHSYTMFDYAGSKYVGSDSISGYVVINDRKNRNYNEEVEINLRQGKHHLLWFTGLDASTYSWYDELNGYPKYDPLTKTVTALPGNYIQYAECDLHVTEYLLPTQKLTFRPLMAYIDVQVTDIPKDIESSGIMIAAPIAGSISIDGDGYKAMKDGMQMDVNVDKNYDKNGKPCYETSVWYPVEHDGSGMPVSVLCPKNGIDNIQLTTEVKDKEGKSIPTTTLPKFSIRRGHTTVLRGPLFSGSTSDWTVTMEPY